MFVRLTMGRKAGIFLGYSEYTRYSIHTILSEVTQMITKRKVPMYTFVNLMVPEERATGTASMIGRIVETVYGTYDEVDIGHAHEDVLDKLCTDPLYLVNKFKMQKSEAAQKFAIFKARSKTLLECDCDEPDCCVEN